MSVTGDALTATVDLDARRALVVGNRTPTLDGIDFVEVLSNRPNTPGHVSGAPEQRTLLVHLLRGPVPVGLDSSDVVILGGVRPDPRVNPVRVLWAYPADRVAAVGVPPPPADPPAGVSDADGALVRASVPEAARARVLVVRTSSSGDWSTYLLCLLGVGASGVPRGFDEPIARAPFSFTVDCPSDLDCRIDPTCPPITDPTPALDYLARDYDALRARLLDRLATLLPAWTDRSPADPGVTLVELFAYLGDRLAYWQDAAATEAYLGTARLRTSVRRHARLLDYRVHEGCSARVWLAFTTEAPRELPAHMPVGDSGTPGATPLDAIEVGAAVFETCAAATLLRVRNQISLHSWGDPEHCLPTGTTSAFVALRPADADPGLRAGDVLILAEKDLDPEIESDQQVESGDPTRRFAVRLDRDPTQHTDPFSETPRVLELHWHGEDALPAPLQVSRRGDDGRAEVVAVALANVVLADHGGSVGGEALDPPQAPEHGSYRPRLRREGLAWVDPPEAVPATASATAMLQTDPRTAVAQLELDDGARVWRARSDLISSGRLDPHVVVEPEADGVSQLRFGDGELGRRPTPLTEFAASYRLGGGTQGNVGAGTLATLLQAPTGQALQAVTVWNPLPAVGGADPEPLDEVREIAPHAFRTQLRAVTSQDYAAVAMENPAVQRAVARRRWSGSWYAQEVTVDPIATRAADPALPQEIAAVLEVRRMAGVDVELARPVYAPLEIVLEACVAPGFVRADVERQLRDVLSARALADGRLGFFHPDRFTFGQPLFLSDLVATVMAVPGVDWVDLDDTPSPPVHFGRMGRAPADEIALGRIDMGAREVLRADSDPSNPENGRVEIILRGGS